MVAAVYTDAGGGGEARFELFTSGHSSSMICLHCRSFSGFGDSNLPAASLRRCQGFTSVHERNRKSLSARLVLAD